MSTAPKEPKPDLSKLTKNQKKNQKKKLKKKAKRQQELLELQEQQLSQLDEGEEAENHTPRNDDNGGITPTNTGANLEVRLHVVYMGVVSVWLGIVAITIL